MSYPTVAEIRVLEPDVADAGRFTDALLTEKRAAAIARIEDICDRHFVPTSGVVETHQADRDGTVRLRRGSSEHGTVTITACSVVAGPGSSSQTVAVSTIWASDSGVVAGFAPGARVTVTYSTGLAECPADVRGVVAKLTALFAMQSKNGSIPDRAERFVAGDTGRPFMLAVPASRRLGMPELDAILNARSLHTGLG